MLPHNGFYVTVVTLTCSSPWQNLCRPSNCFILALEHHLPNLLLCREWSRLVFDDRPTDRSFPFPSVCPQKCTHDDLDLSRHGKGHAIRGDRPCQRRPCPGGGRGAADSPQHASAGTGCGNHASCIFCVSGHCFLPHGFCCIEM